MRPKHDSEPHTPNLPVLFAVTQVLKWYKNGTLVGFQAEGDANAPAGTHFAVGRGAGDFEVRLEDSSFMSEAARGAHKLLESLEEDESDSREERAFRMWINSLGLDTHVNDLIAQVSPRMDPPSHIPWWQTPIPDECDPWRDLHTLVALLARGRRWTAC